MPAKSRGKSEYHRHFRWKSNSLSKLSRVPAAGACPSNCQREPCFQTKKRLEGPASSLSASDFANLNKVNEDYILLGKNDKFQHNIQYKCRTVKRVDTETNKDETNQTQTNLSENSQGVVNDYILLGNNSKFIRNTVYKPRPCPEIMIVNEKNEGDSRMREEPRSILSNLGDDYMLLGNNAKFSDNIVYKPKMWREFNPSQGNGKENKPAEDIEDTDECQVQAKKLEPAPFVDTSKFREPPKKSKKPVEIADDSELKIKKKKKSSAIQEGAKEELKLPLDDVLSGREAIDEKTASNKEKGEVSNSQNVSEEKSVKFLSPPAAPRSPKPSDIQQENDQKLLALLHKAGIRLPPRSVAEQSEYQKNFTWKNPAPNSTAAENKKNFQNTTLLNTRVSHQNSVPKISEYQRNFQAWVPLPTKPASPSPSPIIEKASVQTDPNVQKEPKRQVTKKSKIEKVSNSVSGSSLSKDHQVNNTDQGQESEKDQPDIVPEASGICSDEDADNIQQEDNVRGMKNLESVSDSVAKTKPPKHRESQCLNSEYRANFKAPSKYDYMNNVWESTASLNEDTPPKDDSFKGDWYSEVCDLRRKAAEYRRRANNTHFCAEHMGQLLASETQLWEHNKSDKATTLGVDLRSMRPAGITYNKHFLQRPRVAQNEQLPSDPEPQMTVEDVTDDDDDDVVASVHSEPEPDVNCIPTSSETNVVPVPSPEENDGKASPQIDEDPSEPLESPSGRIPTPELQQQNIKRHHLDRTTPTKGGLLISPARNKKKIDSERSNSPFTAESIDMIKSSHHYSASDVEEKPKHCVKTCALPSKSNCQPTFGKPSKDTHILRAEENLSSSTKPHPKASSVQPPQIMSKDRSNITLRSGGNKRPKKSYTKQHPAGLKISQPIPGSMTSTYRVPPERVHAAKPKTNDFLSQSLESNSSLASEILERTRKRLDFW